MLTETSCPAWRRRIARFTCPCPITENCDARLLARRARALLPIWIRHDLVAPFFPFKTDSKTKLETKKKPPRPFLGAGPNQDCFSLSRRPAPDGNEPKGTKKEAPKKDEREKYETEAKTQAKHESEGAQHNAGNSHDLGRSKRHVRLRTGRRERRLQIGCGDKCQCHAAYCYP